jgi:hypothetical protein
MNVLCLGCSWTAGVVGQEPYNWVTALSKMMPEHNFYNCAQRGSSLLYSIWVMEEFLSKATHDKTPIKIDKIIFQITNEGRLTYLHDYENFNINQCIVKKSDNLFKLNLEWQNVAAINYGVLLPENKNVNHPRWESMHSFATEYYSRLTRQMHFDLEHRALVEYIRPKADLMFMHRKDDIGIPDIISIQDILGDEQFSKFCIDRGSHFSVLGSVWQAHYIKHLLF